jgi:hypothetical protein
MWDYSGGFAVVIKEDGVSTVDEKAIKALGLKIPAGSTSTGR